MKTSDPSDSDSDCDSVSSFTLERKTPYASDSDSASDYVASGNQPYQQHKTARANVTIKHNARLRLLT